MLDDDFMWPLVRQAGMGFVNTRLPTGWSEYKGDQLVADIQREKGLGALEAEQELRTWVERHGGEVRTEMQGGHRPPGSKLRNPGTAVLIVLLLDAAIPTE